MYHNIFHCQEEKALKFFLLATEEYFPSALEALQMKLRLGKPVELSVEVNGLLRKCKTLGKTAMTHKKAAEAYLMTRSNTIKGMHHLEAAISLELVRGLRVWNSVTITVNASY